MTESYLTAEQALCKEYARNYVNMYSSENDQNLALLEKIAWSMGKRFNLVNSTHYNNEHVFCKPIFELIEL